MVRPICLEFVQGVRLLFDSGPPKAMYFHCSAHRLNLAVVSACKIPAFKNAVAYLGEIAIFFSSSTKRQSLLNTAVDKMTTPTKAKKTRNLRIYAVRVGCNV